MKTEPKVKPYEKCLEEERQREKKWRQTAQGRFESAFLSMDRLNDSFDDPTKIGAWSDHGECAWCIEHYPMFKDELGKFKRRLDAALHKIRRVSADLIPTFMLILKYGANREEAIAIIQHRREMERSRSRSKVEKGTTT